MDLHDPDDSKKILVLGPRKAGKTCFIRKYVHGIYSNTEVYKETMGVDFALKKLKIGERQIVLKLWDIAGQELTQHMSRMYYRQAVGCVILFDMTQDRSLEVCNKWKRDLDSKCTLPNGDPVPCILLANKSDLSDSRAFSKVDIETFATHNKFIHWMETSVKTNSNVKESMEYLVQHIISKEEIPLPTAAEPKSILLMPKTPEARKKPCCN